MQNVSQVEIEFGLFFFWRDVIDIESEIIAFLSKAGVDGDIILTAPPNPEMGDFSYACFALAKERKQNPTEVAAQIEAEVRKLKSEVVERVAAVGPYVNFFVNGAAAAQVILKQIDKEGNAYGASKIGKKKKILVEFGCPNPLKAFHLGHLRNLITGESVARILENAGYRVKRVNYQGDVGMHVAKALWGFEHLTFDIKHLASEPFEQRIEFLGRAYAHGARSYESDEKAKAEIEAVNEKVYRRDPAIRELYDTTRQWSLDYFETIYAKFGARYDSYYFESEMTARGVALVNKFLKKGIFEASQGAIIFPGSRYGLHDRVFVNSRGFPTYEGKDVALVERHFKDYHPCRVIHVVGKDQTEYFKVLIAALEKIFPKIKGREFHLVGGYLQLKGEQKMSSRKGNVVTGDELLAMVEKRVGEIMSETKRTISDRRCATKDSVQKITVASLKYGLLRVDVSDDVAFDLESSISTEGDSGPYLLYIVARINSILKKSEVRSPKSEAPIDHIESSEKQLLLRLAEYPEITKKAAEELNPSAIAHYLFDLAQAFNRFYESCPVLQTEGETRQFRLRLIRAVSSVMAGGLALLGIDAVEEM